MGTERDYWESLSNDWEASGQSQRQFCEQKEISFSRFTQWRSMLLSEERRDQVNSARDNSPSDLFSQISTPRLSLESQANTVDSHIEIQLPLGIIMRIPINVAQ